MKAVNLLPSDPRGAPKATAAITARQDAPRGPGAFIVLGALAFGVLALAGYVLTTNTIKDRQAEISRLEVQQQAAERRVAALKPYAEFDQLAKARFATLRDLAGQRFDWDQALRDLSRALPRDVTIKSLDGSLGAAASAPGAAAQQDASGRNPQITLTGCTRSQKSVARLMARLATVNGVTRVKLASSGKSEAAATPAAGSAGATAQEPPCGSGSRPDFNVAVQFGTGAAPASGNAPVPATGAGAATTPAATPSASATPAPTATPSGSGQQASTTSASTAQGGAQ
jgi:Tfp pilus assembly protein PilN